MFYCGFFPLGFHFYVDALQANQAAHFLPFRSRASSEILWNTIKKRYTLPLSCMGLGGRIISFTTASVFPIVFFGFFFSLCIAGFIGSIRRHDPSLTKPSPSLISLCRYNLPVGKRGGSCAIEIAVDDGTARRLQEYVSHPASAVMQPACNQLNVLSDNYVKLTSQSTICATSPFP